MNLKKLLFIGLIITVAGCSTKKNTMVTRGYHNLTSRYNVYFNASEAYKKGMLTIEGIYRDNYTQILPVFTYTDATANASAAPDMDRTITKSSLCIKKHSITTKPKRKKGRKPTEKEKEFASKPEFCNWVDDSYMFMAKAQFFKQEFTGALLSLKYIEKTYEKEPIRYDALLWLIRVYNETGEYEQSLSTLQQLEKDKKFPIKKYEAEINLLYADYFLKQKKYDDAIPKLKQAVKLIKKKRERARYVFILAQLFQRKGNLIESSKLYKEVTKLNPPYELLFNANINRALSIDAKGDTKQLIRQLNKMLKDEKNIEFKDQIYYALGNLALKRNDKKEAIRLFELSVNTSVNNQNQKALSCLALAELYFSQPNYEGAAAYYDSTMQYLPKTYPDYKTISIRTSNLLKLVANLQIVQHEDSIRAIAKLPEEERMKKIDNIIRNVREEEQKKADESRMNQQQMQQLQLQTNNPYSTQTSKWYFYNPQTVQLGKKEFAKKWGNRKLEDNWRRVNKAVVMEDIENIDNQTDTTNTNVSTDENLSKKDRNYYLKELPVSDSAITISDKRIQLALFTIGQIYRERLYDCKEAVKAYEKLNQRFPDHNHKLETYYGLYQCNNINKNPDVAGKYKSMIIAQFPNSKYAKMFTNPNYFSELMATRAEVENLYASTFNFYQQKQYGQVIQNVNKAETDYAENIIMHKFQFIKALATGSTQSPDTVEYATQLTDIIKNYPETDVAQASEDMLRAIREGIKGTKSTVVSDSVELAIFNRDTTIAYIYILALKTAGAAAKADEIRFKYSSFIADNFETADWDAIVTNMDDTKMVTVKIFQNLTTSKNFYLKVNQTPTLFQGINNQDYVQFLISESNFNILLQDKSLDKYLKFFKKYVLK